MTTEYWIAGVSGDGSDAADWQSGAVPGTTDDAVINNSYPVTVNGTYMSSKLGLTAAKKPPLLSNVRQ